jgi:nicotinamidase-related amidase
MNPQLLIENEKTALILIDLQKGIVSMPTEPNPSNVVIKNANMLVQAFHKNKAQVVFVRVAYSHDGKNMLRQEVDEPTVRKASLTPDWSSIVPELEFKEGDLHITKRQWGAFYGTELDLELRRRKINTIVLCGISTNYGVESTARDAFERGYNLIFASDAMASRSASDHEFTITRIFPRIGRIRSTEEIISVMGS